MAILALLCILPLLNVLAISFSSAKAIEQGLVTLWPVELTLRAYRYVAGSPDFLASFKVSFERVILGTLINMLLTIMTAYPLAQESRQFRPRTFYVWIFVFTMLFNGGLVPTYVIVYETGLLDTIWSLVLPGAVPIFNVVLVLNFMRTLPKELTEAGFIDGAGHWTLLWRIVVPLSLPVLATVGLFTIVGHWNEWFHGIIYMNSPRHYPLASYLQTVMVNIDLTKISNPQEVSELLLLNNRAIRAAEIFLAALPVLAVYPFLQRYFITGIVMGSVKE
jgi:putative aldouronate transport system permease protein